MGHTVGQKTKAMNIAINKLQEGRGGEKGAAVLVWRPTVAKRCQHRLGRKALKPENVH